MVRSSSPAIIASPSSSTSSAAASSKMAPSSSSSLDDIVFFDVETTVPSRAGQGYSLLEFGAIVVCPRRLVELGCYSTLVRPADLSAISALSVRCNGITKDAVAVAPTFAEVADSVYSILHGRVWAGHNILRFDCARIREAFREIGRPAPEPKGTIDSLPLLTQKFGRRAGNMKMATLAAYFGLGQQRHRSLDDVRLNLEIVKYCATVLFLESNSMELPHVNSWTSPMALGVDSNRNVLSVMTSPNLEPASSYNFNHKESSLDNMTRNGICNLGESSLESGMGTSVLSPLMEHMNITPKQNEIDIDGGCTIDTPEMLMQSSATTAEILGTCSGFLEPDRVSGSHISTNLVSSNQHGCRMILLHRETPLQLCCLELKIQFGISTKFLDHTGRPKLSVALAAPTSLCEILEACEHTAQESLLKLGSNSEWRPLIKKYCSTGSIVRLNIPTSANEDATTCLAEIYHKEPCGNIRRLDFSNFYASQLECLFIPGTSVDAYFCVDIYDYQQRAGIRLVAKRLVVHSR